jgi:hypothetical protein
MLRMLMQRHQQRQRVLSEMSAMLIRAACGRVM